MAKCAADNACIWPAVEDNLCGFHLRDRDCQASVMGSSHGMLVSFGLAETQESRHERQLARNYKRVRAKKAVAK